MQWKLSELYFLHCFFNSIVLRSLALKLLTPDLELMALKKTKVQTQLLWACTQTLVGHKHDFTITNQMLCFQFVLLPTSGQKNLIADVKACLQDHFSVFPGTCGRHTRTLKTYYVNSLQLLTPFS